MSAVVKVRKLAQWAWEKDQERVTSGRKLDGHHYGAGGFDRGWIRSCLHSRVEDRQIDRALRRLVDSGELVEHSAGRRTIYRLSKPGFEG